MLFGDGASAQSLEECGPEKPKVIKTPFGLNGLSEAENVDTDSLNAIEIAPNQPSGRRLIGSRIVQTRLYLPEKMILGRVSEFTVKGKPGWWVALAMADKDKGAKPLMGHNLRLGPDRKVVAIGKISASGLATLLVECPVEGDLPGSYLYFEAAIWSDENMQDMEIAQCVAAEGKGAGFNGVLIEPQFEQKKGVRIIPTTTAPFSIYQQQGLSSPHP